MKNKYKVLLVMLILLVVGSNAVNVAFAQERAYTISRSVIGAGGIGAVTGEVSIRSTLGQPFTGSTTDGSTTIWSGFWAAMNTLYNDIFLPLILQ